MNNHRSFNRKNCLFSANNWTCSCSQWNLTRTRRLALKGSNSYKKRIQMSHNKDTVCRLLHAFHQKSIFPNLLGSAAKSAHRGTPWAPNRRLACQSSPQEPLLKASFSPPNKPRRRPARLFPLSSRSERGRCQHMRPSSSRLHLLMGRD